jgi:hypothetical protein
MAIWINCQANSRAHVHLKRGRTVTRSILSPLIVVDSWKTCSRERLQRDFRHSVAPVDHAMAVLVKDTLLLWLAPESLVTPLFAKILPGVRAQEFGYINAAGGREKGR